MSRNLIAIRHLETAQIEELLTRATEMKRRILAREEIPARRKVMGMLFFEDSTRTRVSFEQAAYYLGMKSVNFASSSSSMNKGETLKDTILTLRFERLDGMVMRHSASGSAALASSFFGGPVVNAGDGAHEHPTQALADAMTIIERKGSLDGLTVAIVGDVEHSRVARSNAWLLSKMGANVRFVGPRTLLPVHSGMLPGQVYHDLQTGIKDADVVMTLRLQQERMANGLASSVSEYAKLYQVNRERLRWAARDCILMHPGPINRGVELDDAAADGEKSVINQQVENGIFVRMAVLDWVFDDPDETPAPAAKSTKAKKVKA
jgi:aspartate carbamoyltransferase catalytic subunit